MADRKRAPGHRQPFALGVEPTETERIEQRQQPAFPSERCPRLARAGLGELLLELPVDAEQLLPVGRKLA